MDVTAFERSSPPMSASKNPQACQTTARYAETAKTSSAVPQKTETTETEMTETAVARTAQLSLCGHARMDPQRIRTTASTNVGMARWSRELRTTEMTTT